MQPRPPSVPEDKPARRFSLPAIRPPPSVVRLNRPKRQALSGEALLTKLQETESLEGAVRTKLALTEIKERNAIDVTMFREMARMDKNVSFAQDVAREAILREEMTAFLMLVKARNGHRLIATQKEEARLSGSIDGLTLSERSYRRHVMEQESADFAELVRQHKIHLPKPTMPSGPPDSSSSAGNDLSNGGLPPVFRGRHHPAPSGSKVTQSAHSAVLQPKRPPSSSFPNDARHGRQDWTVEKNRRERARWNALAARRLEDEEEQARKEQCEIEEVKVRMKLQQVEISERFAAMYRAKRTNEDKQNSNNNSNNETTASISPKARAKRREEAAKREEEEQAVQRRKDMDDWVNTIFGQAIDRHHKEAEEAKEKERQQAEQQEEAAREQREQEQAEAEKEPKKSEEVKDGALSDPSSASKTSDSFGQDEMDDWLNSIIDSVIANQQDKTAHTAETVEEPRSQDEAAASGADGPANQKGPGANQRGPRSLEFLLSVKKTPLVSVMADILNSRMSLEFLLSSTTTPLISIMVDILKSRQPEKGSQAQPRAEETVVVKDRYLPRPNVAKEMLPSRYPHTELLGRSMQPPNFRPCPQALLCNIVAAHRTDPRNLAYSERVMRLNGVTVRVDTVETQSMPRFNKQYFSALNVLMEAAEGVENEREEGEYEVMTLRYLQHVVFSGDNNLFTRDDQQDDGGVDTTEAKKRSPSPFEESPSRWRPYESITELFEEEREHVMNQSYVDRQDLLKYHESQWNENIKAFAKIAFGGDFTGADLLP